MSRLIVFAGPNESGKTSLRDSVPTPIDFVAETVIQNGDRNFAFDADSFRQRISANAASQAKDGAPPKRAKGRHPHRTGTRNPGRHAGRSH